MNTDGRSMRAVLYTLFGALALACGGEDIGAPDDDAYDLTQSSRPVAPANQRTDCTDTSSKTSVGPFGACRAVRLTQMTERDGVLGARWGWDAPIDSWGVEALPVTLPPGVRAKDVDTLEITNVDTAKSQRTDGAARIMFYFGEPRLVSIRNKLFSNEGPNRFHYRLVLKAAPSRPLEYDFSLTLLPR